MRTGECEHAEERPPRRSHAASRGLVFGERLAAGRSGRIGVVLGIGFGGRVVFGAGLSGLPVEPRVEGIFEGVYALGTGRCEQPPRYHAAPLRQFDPAHRRPHLNVDAGRRVEQPRSGAAVGSGFAISRGWRIGHEPAVGEHNRPVRKPQVGVEIKTTGGHDFLARFQLKTVARSGPSSGERAAVRGEGRREGDSGGRGGDSGSGVGHGERRGGIGRRNGLYDRWNADFKLIVWVRSGLEGLGSWRNRILRGLPNIPKLTGFQYSLSGSVGQAGIGPPCKKYHPTAFLPAPFVPQVVIHSMNASLIAVPKPARGLLRAGLTAGCRSLLKSSRDRHATCMPSVFLEKDSHFFHESVNFFQHRATAVQGNQKSLTTRSRLLAARRTTEPQSGWNHGAARNGNRKRTRVRVACGGGIRPRGLGHQPIHGQFGLSVVGREILSPIVHQPGCELRVRQRHLSRGPGLLAALMPRDTAVAWTSAYERRPADHQAVWATRPAGCTVIGAASVLTCPPERPAAGRGAHHPSPRTRLRVG